MVHPYFVQFKLNLTTTLEITSNIVMLSDVKPNDDGKPEDEALFATHVADAVGKEVVITKVEMLVWGRTTRAIYLDDSPSMQEAQAVRTALHE